MLPQPRFTWVLRWAVETPLWQIFAFIHTVARGELGTVDSRSFNSFIKPDYQNVLSPKSEKTELEN